ncbi:hypothetical protein [Caenibacillus caldisaponilyticus]|uniref:hypothetical protein n=1 Tax=Caenibacillus caldisaponilyticus TaxID=1674942 RepID=UPI00350E5160
MTPLGDMLGISRQTSVLAYQLGNGFTNMLYPTTATPMASLGLARAHWWTWVKGSPAANPLFYFVPARHYRRRLDPVLRFTAVNERKDTKYLVTANRNFIII